MSSKRPPIAYITQSFPSLTTTFIAREVSALRKIGLHIVTFAVWRPNPNSLSEESKDFVKSTYYVFPISWVKFIVAHLYFLLAHPVKYISTLFFVVTRRGENIKDRCRTLFHFCEAIYLALDMKKEGIKHIHAHFTINAASVAMIIGRILNVSFSFTDHNNFFTDTIILKEKIKRSKFIISISEHSRDFLLELLPEHKTLLKGKFHIVHCGVAPEDFSPSRQKAINERPLIFSISQFAERKGYPFLVEACHILDERGYDFQCIIAGDGPQRPLLEQLIRNYQLQSKVHLVGVVFQEQLGDYLNRTDIFVLPCVIACNGDRDGVPVALMEAMAMELPSISTYVSGIPELIEDGQSGLLVKEKDAVALADAIQRLIGAPELRLQLGQNARQKIMREFNIHKSGEQLGALFEVYVNNKHYVDR
jgi:glycosyltransferase involved in cell wall biosynthesis